MMNIRQMINLHTRIVVPPKWITVLPSLLADLERGTDKRKAFARDELTHMAQVADLVQESAELSRALHRCLLYIHCVLTSGEALSAATLEQLSAYSAKVIAKANGEGNAHNPT